MDGCQLYQQYTKAGQLACRDSDAWHYGHLLQRAFHIVGITRLFDLLEQAEAGGQRIDLVFTSTYDGALPVATDIKLVNLAPPTLPGGDSLTEQFFWPLSCHTWWYN